MKIYNPKMSINYFIKVLPILSMLVDSRIIVLGRDILTSDVKATSRSSKHVQRSKSDVGAKKGRVLPGLAGKHAFAAPLLRGNQTARLKYKAKRVVFVHYILTE
jgi:hypothetical protein